MSASTATRRRILVANSDGFLAGDDQTRTLFVVGVVAAGDTGMQTGRRSIGHTMGFELFDRYQVEDLAREAAEQALTQAPGPPGALGPAARGHRQGRWRRAVPRGVRPRPRGRPHPEEGVGLRRPGGPGWWPRRSSPSSTTAPWATSGAPSPSTTRARRRSATC
ncbi:MAG: hypothetical protein R2711_06575 [Acidimicrobiales bacterium]